MASSNKEKFLFGQEIATFAGFEITMGGYRPLEKLLDAVKQFPIPENLTDVRSCLGLINHATGLCIRTKAIAPFRELFQNNTFN